MKHRNTTGFSHGAEFAQPQTIGMSTSMVPTMTRSLTPFGSLATPAERCRSQRLSSHVRVSIHDLHQEELIFQPMVSTGGFGRIGLTRKSPSADWSTHS